MESCRGPYRKYLQDPSIEIPKTTMWRHKRRLSFDDTSNSKIFRNFDDLSSSNCVESHNESVISASSSEISSHEVHCNESLDVSVSPLLPIDASSPLRNSLLLDESVDRMDASTSESYSQSVLSEGIFHSSDSISSDSSSNSQNGELSDNGFKLPCIDNNPELFEPVYSESTVTISGAICAIMQFCMAHKLSYTAIGDLLNLLQLLVPTPNLLPTSVYRFKKFFQRLKMEHTYTNYCSNCDKMKEECCCDHPTCNSHLVHIPVEKSLYAVLSNHWEHLHSVDSHNEDVLKDIWDAQILKELYNKGEFFYRKHHIALALSVDGVALYKSSSITLYPVLIVILNLPPDIRMNAENIILAGLYVGPKKPVMKLLLDPVMKNLEHLFIDGLTMSLPGGLTTVKTKLVFGVFDLIAKAPVLNFKQFNGEFGCSVCYHPGLRLSNGARIYLPYSYPERTHAEVINAANEAERDKCAVKGILGTSPLAGMLDVVEAVPIDYMHCCLEGVVKSLMKYWFNSSYHHKPYYIGLRQNQIDSKLLQQHPPTEFSRPPRSIKHLQYWKASELRNWLLFYSLPLLITHLPALYFHHYALFVCAMHMLLSNELSLEKIEAAGQMIIDFCSFLPELYDDNICTHNMHLLTHLTKYVKLWGPLWTHSTFGCENKNGHLKRLFHGKNQIHQQLLFSVDVSITLQLLRPALSVHEDVTTMNFIDHLNNLALRSNMSVIREHMYIIGSCKATNLTEKQCQGFRCASNSVHNTFSKLYKDGNIYSSVSASRDNAMRCDTVCMFKSADLDSIQFGLIEIFISSTRETPTALIWQFICEDNSILQRAGHPCRHALQEYQEADLLKQYIVAVKYQTSTLTAIKVDDICGKVVLIDNGIDVYVIIQPNNYERH